MIAPTYNKFLLMPNTNNTSLIFLVSPLWVTNVFPFPRITCMWPIANQMLGMYLISSMLWSLLRSLIACLKWTWVEIPSNIRPVEVHSHDYYIKHLWLFPVNCSNVFFLFFIFMNNIGLKLLFYNFGFFLAEDIFTPNVPIPCSCCISRYVFVAIVHDREFIVLH